MSAPDLAIVTKIRNAMASATSQQCCYWHPENQLCALGGDPEQDALGCWCWARSIAVALALAEPTGGDE